MESLFRFSIVRPPIAPDPKRPSISLSQQSQLQVDLAAASNETDPRVATRNVARQFANTGNFLTNLQSASNKAEIESFGTALSDLEQSDVLTKEQIVAAAETAFGKTISEIIADDDFKSTVARLRDSILAIKYLQEEHTQPLEDVVNRLRDLELILDLSGDAEPPKSGPALRDFRKRSLKLPTEAELDSILSTAKAEEEARKKLADELADRQKRAESLLQNYNSLRSLIEELTDLGEEHFENPKSDADEGFSVPKPSSASEIYAKRATFLQSLSDINLKQMQRAIDRQEPVDPLVRDDLAGASTALELAKVVLNDDGIVESPPFRPLGPGENGFRLTAAAVAQLSETGQKLLTLRKLNPALQPLDFVVDRLEKERDLIGDQLSDLFGEPVQKSVRKVGNSLVTISTPVPTEWARVSIGLRIIPLLKLPLDLRIPRSKGKVAPAGIADLLVVKQQLVGYEGADIAHIENVLKGEKKAREHTSRRETEQFSFQESEVTSTEERELETTSRFEMSRETSKVISEDASLKAGLSVTGRYGPFVEFSASAEGAISRSKTESTKSASSFAQDVTQRSAMRITERVLERSSTRITNEVIEKNTHELNNVNGDGHIAGMYQWVNKVYQAQMYNYGLRTMFDFMIPEPAAFLMDVLKSAHASAIEIEKPPAFNLKPEQLYEANYGYWVKVYGATDVEPPPEMYRTKSLDFKAGGGDSKTNYTHSGQVAIDPGYQAIQGSVAVVGTNWDRSRWNVDVVLGRKTHRFNDSRSWVWTTWLSDERDSIPVALATFRKANFAVAIEVKTKRTQHAYKKWQLDTHAKLTTAYQAKLAEYEEKLAALELEAGVSIEGRNPAANQELMKEELKKNCISIITNQHFDLFDAVNDSSSNGFSQIDIFEAAGEGPYVRFFEQAFEWEQMTWVTYPYFWGRKSLWDERITFDDPDPLFNQFLKSGFCRVSVPARPGFEGAIDHFMNFGEIWRGGPLPTISSDLFLPIANEIAERLDRPGDEVPQGDPWTVRVPTSLVRLRDDDSLPNWSQNAEGEWVEG